MKRARWFPDTVIDEQQSSAVLVLSILLAARSDPGGRDERDDALRLRSVSQATGDLSMTPEQLGTTFIPAFRDRAQFERFLQEVHRFDEFRSASVISNGGFDIARNPTGPADFCEIRRLPGLHAGPSLSIHAQVRVSASFSQFLVRERLRRPPTHGPFSGVVQLAMSPCHVRPQDLAKGNPDVTRMILALVDGTYDPEHERGRQLLLQYLGLDRSAPIRNPSGCFIS